MPTRINHFDASIPGQSLTDTPGNAAWEHPPQFVEPEKALEYVFSQIMKPRNYKQFVIVLKQGAYIEQLARTLIFGGFTEGKWTPDVGMLMMKPLIVMLSGLARQAGINAKVSLPRKETPAELAFNRKQITDKIKKFREETPETETLFGGFMTPTQEV